jgi:hypothetical protein
MKDISDALRKRQKLIKQQTIKKVQCAIDDLKDEGYLIGIKHLVERTGLSRSVFRKPHVQKILKENKIGIYKESKTVPKSNEDYRILALAMEKELLRANNKIQKLEDDLKDRDKRITRLVSSLEEKTNECALLRGEIFILAKKAKIMGIDSGNISKA